jgi:cold shock protein
MATKGTVKWFSNQKGYGFVSAENKDYFAHFSDIKSEGYRTLSEGEEVEFDITADGQGRDKATNIVRLNPPARKPKRKEA